MRTKTSSRKLDSAAPSAPSPSKANYHFIVPQELGVFAPADAEPKGFQEVLLREPIPGTDVYEARLYYVPLSYWIERGVRIPSALVIDDTLLSKDSNA